MIKWRINNKSIFFENISAFLIALNGLPALFNKNYVSSIEPNDGINLEGIGSSKNMFNRLELIKLMNTNLKTIPKITLILSQQLVISCYEIVKDKNDGSPEFEFFRHLRNGCAHNNKFNFATSKKANKLTKVPSKPAKWRNFKITRSLNGKKVIFGFIAPGDILEFLCEMSERFTHPTRR